jgi:hypothetical protein
MLHDCVSEHRNKRRRYQSLTTIRQGQENYKKTIKNKQLLRPEGIGNRSRYDHSHPNGGLLATTSCGDAPLHVVLGLSLRAALHFVGSRQWLGKLTMVGSVVFFINVNALKRIELG